MRSPRSTTMTALAIGCALVLGLLALLGSAAPTARAWPPQRTPGPAFVAPGGVDDLCTQDSPCGSIQYAIDQADPGNGDTIYVAGGVYTGTGVAVITVTKSITLYAGWDGAASGPPVRDPAAYPTTLDGENARRVVYIESCAPRLEGFTIVRGNATGLTATCGTGAAGCGGGIMAYDASPIIVGNTISGNVAATTSPGNKVGYGGGVLLLNGSGLLQDNLIQGNVASNADYGRGGGVDLYSTSARVEGNRILSNTAVVAGTAYGGGGIGGTPNGAVIVGNVIEGNRARAGSGGRGGGIYEFAGHATYSGNRVRGNTGSSAVYLERSYSRLEGNLVLDNATTDGIYLIYGGSTVPVLANNVVAHGGGGAAVVAKGSTSQPLTTTLVCNTLAGTGAGRGLSIEPYATAVMTDNTVSGFAWGITATNMASATVLADHTLFWANADDGLQGTNAVAGDPAFRNAAAGDYHIRRTSAALDAGVPVDLSSDIDGDPRPLGLGYDIGADERPIVSAPGPAFVEPGGVDDLCTRASPCGSIQYAIGMSTPGHGDTIYVAGGVYTGTGEAVITVTKSVTLYAGWDGAMEGDVVRDPAAYPSTLDGENARRVVYIEGCAPTLDGFTIVHGNATGLTDHCPSLSGAAAGCGGGIMVYDASPVIVGNTISGNVAATSGYAYGGGVQLAYAPAPILRGNLIQGNVASGATGGAGGGLHLLTTGALVEANRILSNTAAAMVCTEGWGGGIAGRPNGATVVGNTIEGNRATAGSVGYGGGLYEWYGLAVYSGNLVRANAGDSAVYLGGSGSRFEGNLVLDNASTDGIRLIYSGFADLVLANNVVAHTGSGTAVRTDGSSGDPLRATLACNTLAGAGVGAGLAVAPYSTVVMTDNIVTGFAWGITVTMPASSTLLADHTLFWANAHDGLRGTAPVDGNPAFTDAAARDYHIGVTSAARNAGVPVDVAVDMDGEARPVGAQYDIGADERGWWLGGLPLVLRQ